MKKYFILGILIVILLISGCASITGNVARNVKDKKNDNVGKLSQASLDLDTHGCPTTFGQPSCEKQTQWSLDKTTEQDGMVDPEGEVFIF